METTTYSDVSPVRHARGASVSAPVRRSALCALLGLALTILAVPVAFAQTTGSATVRGVIKDPNGEIVPDANVTLTNDKTGYDRKSKATSDGVYSFAQIEPGIYTLKVEADRFKAYKVTGLNVAPSDTRGQDVTLELGLISDSVTVTAAEEVVTETGEKAHTITATQLQNLSLIGRSSLELLRVLPGVVAPDGTQLESLSFGGGGNANNMYSVNGLRGVNNNVSIDGSRLMDIGSNNGTIITPNNDFVQEVKVQVSNFAAEYGNSAVQISAVTKGGGKDFHGSLYDYSRPWQATANRPRSRSSAGLDRPHNRFNYPGGTLSGPVLLPWTASIAIATSCSSSSASRRSASWSRTTPDLQSSRRSSSARAISASSSTVRYLQQSYGSVKIPGGFAGAGDPIGNGDLRPYIDPIGQILINLYPQPNGLFAGGAYNYATAAPSETNRFDWKMRFDYRPSDRDQHVRSVGSRGGVDRIPVRRLVGLVELRAPERRSRERTWADRSPSPSRRSSARRR